MLSVSWTLIDEVLAQAGPLDGKIVIDTTNQFGREGWEDLGEQTAAQVNAARMPGARYTKAFNTLTSGFQAAGGRAHGTRPRGACSSAATTRRPSASSAGSSTTPASRRSTSAAVADAAPMEAPRRAGAVYGEELHEQQARDFVARRRSS